jgi:hypothetical protein
MSDPLNSDEIKRGYTADVTLATRNAATLRWLNALDNRPNVAAFVAREYAEWSKIDVDQVRGALDYITDQPSLNWIYGRYWRDIELDGGV